MNFGKLNKRLALKTVTRVADNMGGYVETIVLKKTAWGSLTPVSQVETLSYGMALGSRVYKSKIRWDENYDIDQNYYIEWVDRYDKTRKFRIISVLKKEESAHEIELLLNERTD